MPEDRWRKPSPPPPAPLPSGDWSALWAGLIYALIAAGGAFFPLLAQTGDWRLLVSAAGGSACATLGAYLGQRRLGGGGGGSAPKE